jgi:uncharacterized FlgJ-related protein
VQCVKFTNRFDGIELENTHNVEDCDYIEGIPRDNAQNAPTVSTVPDIQSSDKHINADNQNIASSDSNARYPKRDRSRPKHLNDYVLEDNSVNVTVHYCYRMSDIPISFTDAMSSMESGN